MGQFLILTISCALGAVSANWIHLDRMYPIRTEKSFRLDDSGE